MTMAASKPPAQDTPTRRVRGLLTSAVTGAALASFIGGCVAQRWNLIILSFVLPPAYGLLYSLVTLPRRLRQPPVAQCTALAMIECVEASSGPDEDGDVPMKFELSVVPDDAPGFRVQLRQHINLAAVPLYQPRGIVVVQYRQDQPLKARILTKPKADWAERAASATLDSVPGPALTDGTPASCTGCLLTFLAFLIGAGAILGLFHSEIFAAHKDAAVTAPPDSSSTSTTTTTTTTTTVTSNVGTVTLGTGQSMLDPGELRTAVQSVTGQEGDRPALTMVVQDDQLTVVFVPEDVKTGFDLKALPYDRIPELVQETKGMVGIGTPRSWQVTATGSGETVSIKVVVSGDKGSGFLVADGQGNVISRSGG